MAVLGEWQGGAKTQGNLPESWTAPTNLFDTLARNDGSAYGWNASTSTLTLPSSDLADGYRVEAYFEYHDTSNGRFNPQGRFILASGTGNFVSATVGGFSRDTSEDRSYVRVWCFVDDPSAAATIQFQWKADSDDATGGTEASVIQVTPWYYSNIHMSTSTSSSLYGGTTPNQVTGWSVVHESDTAAIELSSNQVSTKGSGKRYAAWGSQFYEGRGGRTQRWIGFREGGSKLDYAKVPVYYRNTSNDESGGFYSWLFEGSNTIDHFCYRGDGVSAGQGGADGDGSTPSVGAHAMVVLELNDDAEAFATRHVSESADLNVTGPVDLDISETSGVDIEDTDSFGRVSDSAIEVKDDFDAYFAATIGAAQEVVGTTSRWTAFAHITIDGVEAGVTKHGNYARNNQGSIDTFGWGASPGGAGAVTNGQDIGLSIQELSGGEDGGEYRIQAGWAGMWGVNLDTLEDTGGALTETATDDAGVTDSTTAVKGIAVEIVEAVGVTDSTRTAFQVTLENTADPADDTNHELQVRAAVATGAATLVLELRQGSTVINTWTQALTTTPTDYNLAVTGSSISNYNDLSVYGYVEPGATGETRIYRLRLCLPAAAGTSHTQTVNEAVGVTDSAAIVLDAARTATDDVDVTDAVSRIHTAERSTDEDADVTDSVETSVAAARSVTDDAGVTDQVTRVQSLERTIPDDAAVTDEVSARKSTTQATDEPFGVSDQISRIHEAERTTDDDAGVTDSVSAAKTITVEITEAVGVADTVDTVLGISVEISETVGVTDTIERIHTAERSIDETVGISDVVSDTETNRETINEPAGITDAVDRVHAGERSTTDEVGVTDSVAAAKATAAETTDPVGVTDETVPVVEAARAVDDPAGVTDDTTATKSIVVEISESVGVTDQVSGLVSSDENQTVIDDLGVTDQVSRIHAAERTPSDDVGVVDQVTAAKAIAVEITETVGVTDQVDRTHTAARTINDPAGMTDSASDVLSGDEDQTVTDTLGVTDTATRVHTAERTTTDDVGVTDAVAPAKAIVVEITETVGTTDEVANASTITVEIDEPLTVTDTPTRTVDYTRDILDGLGATDQLSRIVDYSRTADESVGITDQTSTLFIPSGTGWWTENPVAYSRSPVGATANPTGVTRDPVDMTSDPVGYDPVEKDELWP